MSPLRKTYLLFIYAFLYIPLLVLITYSFINGNDWSLHWYRVLANDSQLWEVVKNSLLLAIISASICTALGSIFATTLARYRFLGNKIISTSFLIYIILPDLLIGISLLIIFHTFSIPLGFGTLLIGHITFCLPFIIMMINARLHDINHHILDAAKDLGASDAVIYIRILCPMLLTALISAWMIGFTLSMDDVIISFFLSGPDFQVLPLYIYSLVRLGITPEINAICSIIFFLTFFIIIIAHRWIKKR